MSYCWHKFLLLVLVAAMASASAVSIWQAVKFQRKSDASENYCANHTIAYVGNITVYLGSQFDGFDGAGFIRYVYAYQTDKNCELYFNNPVNVGDQVQLYAYDGNWCYGSVDQVEDSCSRDGPIVAWDSPVHLV